MFVLFYVYDYCLYMFMVIFALVPIIVFAYHRCHHSSCDCLSSCLQFIFPYLCIFPPIYVDYFVPMFLSVCVWIQIWVSRHLLSCMWSALLCCCHQLTSHNSCTVVQVQTQCQSTYRSTVGTRPWAHTVGPSCPPNSCPTVTPWRLSSAHADPPWLSPDFSPTTSLSQVMLDKSFSFLSQIDKILKTDLLITDW